MTNLIGNYFQSVGIHSGKIMTQRSFLKDIEAAEEHEYDKKLLLEGTQSHEATNGRCSSELYYLDKYEISPKFHKNFVSKGLKGGVGGGEKKE